MCDVFCPTVFHYYASTIICNLANVHDDDYNFNVVINGNDV